MSLQDKLQRLANNQQTHTVDWTAKRDKWIGQVNKLYNDIRQWLGTYETDGYLTFTTREITLSEEYVSLYQIDELEINIGPYTVVLQPIGLNVIGALGRVDIFLSGHKADGIILMLMDRGSQPVWEIYRDKRKDSGHPLTRESLEALLDEWIVT